MASQQRAQRRTAPVLLSAPVTVSTHPGGMPHIRATIRKMSELARAGQGTYAIRNLATRITAHVPSKQPAAELRALYNWVRDNIRYRFDPVDLEWVQSPERTVKEKAGDCDDMATLLAALAGSLGHRWRFRTVGDSPNAQRHVSLQAFGGQQWIDLDPVLESPQASTAPRTDAGTFGLHARGAAHLWDSGGNMLRGLSGPTSAQDRKLWSIVPYFPPAPPWGPYGGIQPPNGGAFPRINRNYRSPDAPGFEGGNPYAKLYGLTQGSVFSAPPQRARRLPAQALQGQMGAVLSNRFKRRFKKLARKVGKGILATTVPGADIALAAKALRDKRRRQHRGRGLSGPTTADERELWNWIPYDPTTGGAMAGVPGVLLALPPGFGGLAGEMGLIPLDHPTLGAGFAKKLKRAGKKFVKGVKVVVKNPVFRQLAKSVISVVPGGSAALAAGQAAKLAAGAIKGGVKLAKGIKAVKKGKLSAQAKKALAAQAKKVGATSLVAALPSGGKSGGTDWKKPHAHLRTRYPSNARQMFDAHAGVFRVFVPSAGLSAGAIQSLRKKGGKAKPRKLAGLGAIRPTISFSLGAVASSAAAARSPALVAAAKTVVNAVNIFAKNHAGKPPAVKLPATTTFQTKEGNLTIDGLYGTNTHAAVSWYLQGSGVQVPAYAPGLKQPLTWSPPITALSPVAATPQPPAPSPKGAPPKAPAATPKPVAGASFPAPGGFVEVGAESANPGLAPAGYTGPGAKPAPAVPGTPRQPGAPTGGAPKPAEPEAIAQAAEAGAYGDEEAGAAAQEAASAPAPIADLVPLTPALDPYGMPTGPSMGPVFVSAPDTTTGPVTRGGLTLIPTTQFSPDRLPVTTGPVPQIPLSPTTTPPNYYGAQPSSGGGGGDGSGNGILWAALAYLYFKARKAA